MAIVEVYRSRKTLIFASDCENEEENTLDYQIKEIYLTSPDLTLGMLELHFHITIVGKNERYYFLGE